MHAIFGANENIHLIFIQISRENRLDFFLIRGWCTINNQNSTVFDIFLENVNVIGLFLRIQRKIDQNISG